MSVEIMTQQSRGDRIQYEHANKYGGQRQSEYPGRGTLGHGLISILPHGTFG
jgi:hypothetical protein